MVILIAFDSTNQTNLSILLDCFFSLSLPLAAFKNGKNTKNKTNEKQSKLSAVKKEKKLIKTNCMHASFERAKRIQNIESNIYSVAYLCDRSMFEYIGF